MRALSFAALIGASSVVVGPTAGCGQDDAKPSSDGGGATDDGTLGGPSDAADGASPGSAVDAGASVLQHHKNLNRDGLYIEPALSKAAVMGSAGGGTGAGLHRDTTFSATLPDPRDQVYAQPLFVDGMGGRDVVIVATQADNVYALDAVTGAAVWTAHLGTPVPLSTMPCGNIDPFGITGTPVIDIASRTLYVDAMVTPDDAGATKKHLIYALSIDDGAVRSGWPIDVAAKAKSGSTAFIAQYQGQRAALALVGGTLYVPFGGLYGDCGTYHGWVVAISTADPTNITSWATTANAGGIWAPAGVSSDGTSIFVSTGNTQGAGKSWGGGEGVVRFGTGSAFGPPADFFAPNNWPSLDSSDLDLGTSPIPFSLAGSTPSQLALAFGKDGMAYLLDRNHLGGVAASVTPPAPGSPNFTFFATAQAATNQIITAPALYTTATATYVAFRANGAQCASGTGDLATLKIVPGTPPTFASSWCASGGAGSPMVTTTDGRSDAIVWTLGVEGDNFLHAFDGDTGAKIAFPASATTVPHMRRFNAAIAAKGRIFVGADNAVFAFTL
jgi:PQQ enzyme repeat